MRIVRAIFFLMFAAFMYSALARFAATGAPIPTQYGGYWPPAARNNCLETYYANRSFACDRVYNWSN